MTTLRITQVKSRIGHRRTQRDTLRTLGLRRIGQVVERPDTPSVRGLLKTVFHLVTFEEVEEPEKTPKKPRRTRSQPASPRAERSG